MGKYGVPFEAFTTATADLTAAYVNLDTSTDLVEIVELAMFGAGATAAADTQHKATGTIMTGAVDGTGTAVTPQPFDEGSAAALPTTTVNLSADATANAGVAHVKISFNQRGGMRWAVPRGEGMHVSGAETNNAYGWQVVSSAAGVVDGYVHFWNP